METGYFDAKNFPLNAENGNFSSLPFDFHALPDIISRKKTQFKECDRRGRGPRFSGMGGPAI